MESTKQNRFKWKSDQLKQYKLVQLIRIWPKSRGFKLNSKHVIWWLSGRAAKKNDRCCGQKFLKRKEAKEKERSCIRTCLRVCRCVYVCVCVYTCVRYARVRFSPPKKKTPKRKKWPNETGPWSLAFKTTIFQVAQVSNAIISAVLCSNLASSPTFSRDLLNEKLPLAFDQNLTDFACKASLVTAQNALCTTFGRKINFAYRKTLQFEPDSNSKRASSRPFWPCAQLLMRSKPIGSVHSAAWPTAILASFHRLRAT